MTYGDDATSCIVHGDCQHMVKEYKVRFTLAIGSSGITLVLKVPFILYLVQFSIGV